MFEKCVHLVNSKNEWLLLSASFGKIWVAWPVTFTFLLIAIFYHTKTESRAKESQIQSFCKKVQTSAQLKGI